MGWDRLIRLAVVSSGMCLAACSQSSDVELEPADEDLPEVEVPRVIPGEMVLIPEGEFTFGEQNEESSAYPEQKVLLPAFWIDKYEVTNAEYLDFSIKNSYASEGKNWRLHFTAAKANYPVMNITYADSEAYCKWAGKRLLTEQEWEKAARGNEGFRYPWGNEWEPGRTNTYEEGIRDAAEIGLYNDVSAFEIHDMLGNVQEWTSTWYKAYKGNTKKDRNFGERYRVVRGLNHSIYGSRTPIWTRSAYLPKALYGFGCRCARDASDEKTGQ